MSAYTKKYTCGGLVIQYDGADIFSMPLAIVQESAHDTLFYKVKQLHQKALADGRHDVRQQFKSLMGVA